MIKSKLFRYLFIIFLLAIMLVFVVNNYSPVEAETEITKNDEIFCYTIDTQENKIYSFKSEYDDEWYLCVP